MPGPRPNPSNTARERLQQPTTAHDAVELTPRPCPRTTKPTTQAPSQRVKPDPPGTHRTTTLKCACHCPDHDQTPTRHPDALPPSLTSSHVHRTLASHSPHASASPNAHAHAARAPDRQGRATGSANNLQKHTALDHTYNVHSTPDARAHTRHIRITHIAGRGTVADALCARAS